MLTIIGWVIGAILTLIGGIWLICNLMMHGLVKTEVELMKRETKIEGEPDYMKDFRVFRSEWDLEINERNKYKAISILVIGILILILAYLSIHSFF